MIFFLKPRIWSKGIRLRHLSIWVGAVIAAHVVAMVALEGMTIFEAIWLTATTIVTVGYGDLSAKTELGRVATMLLYGAGILPSRRPSTRFKKHPRSVVTGSVADNGSGK